MTMMKSLGFRPAFLDYATMTIYPSEFAIAAAASRATLIAGFERDGFFYTRTAAARAALQWGTLRPSTRIASR
ncbi:MAG TPA: hypothetical protein VM073_03615 [Usitatibacter sp.]|nr:hypothetical protein [Usitatibacter sp.]